MRTPQQPESVHVSEAGQVEHSILKRFMGHVLLGFTYPLDFMIEIGRTMSMNELGTPHDLWYYSDKVKNHFGLAKGAQRTPGE